MQADEDARKAKRVHEAAVLAQRARDLAAREDRAAFVRFVMAADLQSKK